MRSIQPYQREPNERQFQISAPQQPQPVNQVNQSTTTFNRASHLNKQPSKIEATTSTYNLNKNRDAKIEERVFKRDNRYSISNNTNHYIVNTNEDKVRGKKDKQEIENTINAHSPFHQFDLSKARYHGPILGKSQGKKNEYFSFKALNALTNRSPNEVIDFFYQKDSLPLAFQETRFSDDMIIIMVSLLHAIIQINSSPAQEIISSIAQNTFFFQKTVSHYLSGFEFDLTSLSFLKLIRTLISFYISICDKFSNLHQYLNMNEISPIVGLISQPHSLIYCSNKSLN